MKVLAFDFGASTGRAILGDFSDGKLTYKEIHRFENTPIVTKEGLFWDFTYLLGEIHKAIDLAKEAKSIAFDTWGVDFGLISKEGKLLENPRHYRDDRTLGIFSKVKMPLSELYQKTGNQIMEINTLFQLISMEKAEILEKAETLLFMPDLFSYMLCGKKACERTIASTSQMLDIKTGKFNEEILQVHGINKYIFPNIVESGTILGEFNGKKIISVAGHDTQCAITAIPSNDENIAFLSSGTWSLLGTELDEPIFDDSSFSHEIGANSKINYLKNITGLWLIQESKRHFESEGKNYSFSDLEKIAREAKPFACFIDTDDEEFAKPFDIPKKVKDFCKKTNQYVPQTDGEIIRCIYESLAMKYRDVFLQMKNLTKKDFKALYILGGGSQAKLLVEMTTNALSIDVYAGIKEATAIGNILIQLKALGEISSIEEARELVKNTEEIKKYTPTENFDDAYKVYSSIIDSCKKA